MSNKDELIYKFWELESELKRKLDLYHDTSISERERELCWLGVVKTATRQFNVWMEIVKGTDVPKNPWLPLC